MSSRSQGESTQPCPACGAALHTVGRAVLSPWVRERIGTRTKSTEYRLCGACGTGAFSYRFSDGEMDALYSRYRGPAYFDLRHSWEPSYSMALNTDLGDNPEVVRARQDLLVEALDRSLPDGRESVVTVIDVGGDRGQFIPPVFPRRFVLDVSDKPPVGGVNPVATLTEAAREAPDLVMVCGLLEHLASPRDMLASIDECVAGPVLIYVEVPAGVPDPRKRQVPRIAHTVGWAACHSKAAWGGLDRLSGRWRSQRSQEFPLMPLRQSEHLNFFTSSGLVELAGRADCDVLLVDEYDMPTQLLEGGRLGFSRVLRGLLRTRPGLAGGR